MGIPFNYQQEYRQNWLYITVAVVAAAFLTIITLSTDNIFYKYLTIDQMQSMLIQFYDWTQTYMSLLISITFMILLRALYKRFAMLNSFLRYEIIFFIFI